MVLNRDNIRYREKRSITDKINCSPFLPGTNGPITSMLITSQGDTTRSSLGVGLGVCDRNRAGNPRKTRRLFDRGLSPVLRQISVERVLMFSLPPNVHLYEYALTLEQYLQLFVE